MRWIRNLTIALALGLSVVGQAAPRSAPRPAPVSDLARIKSSGVLKVATAGENTPPFSYQNAEGKRVGVDVEIAEALAEKLGVRLEWVAGLSKSYQSAFDLLRSGKADIALSALFPTLDRVAAARFTKPYLRIRQILFVNRLRATALKLPTDYDGIIGRTDLVYGYYPEAGTADAFLRRELAAKWVPYTRLKPDGPPAREKMIADFAKGELTAAWIDELELEKWRRTKPDIDVHGFIVDIPEGEIPLAIAVRRDLPELLEWVNLFVDQAQRGNALKRIFARHRIASAKDAP